MNVQPLNDFILVQPVEADDKTASGLYVPDVAREAPVEGTVLAVAAGVDNGVVVGDRVVFKRFAGEELHVNGDTLKLVAVADLLARYVEADAID
ncbi:MAG TPA: co-chaperone GroES [Longimicrobiales bacterium]|nr:co-chaperone GroES [Longimicrobiales bacterium]